jgi:hypothetical protein
MEPSSFLSPHQRARAEITNEVQILTYGKISAKRTKTTHHTNNDTTIYTSLKLLVKRSTKKKWSHSYKDVTVIKDDLSYREEVFNLPYIKWILLSDLEVFEVRDVGKSGLVIGIAYDGCEKMVVYVYERQCEEIGHK